MRYTCKQLIEWSVVVNHVYRECYFVYTKNNKNEICIKMPHNLNTNTSSAIYIYGALNESHVFNAKYLLEYN